MALNPFFQQGSTAEQNLVQSLINEQLKIYGIEVYYIPRKYINTNNIIREVLQSEFKNAYPLEAYVQNYDGFDGNQDLMSKFGVRVTDELTLVISKERYESYIQPILEGLFNANESEYKLYTRPKEGDLIWFPLSDTIFQIKYVEHEKPFYQLKENYVYELRCEIFEYDNEVIDTGVIDIDDNAADDGYILSLNLAGIGSTATAITTLVTGAVNQLNLINSGLGYTLTPPIVAITSAPSGGIDATAVAITTQLSSGSYAVDELRIVNPGAGYTQAPMVRFVSNSGSGAIATAGITTLGSIGIVTVSSGGSEYATVPTITIDGPSIGTTATAIAKIISNSVTQIQITNAGSGYTSTPTITVSDPVSISTGGYTFNEIITGAASSTTARVKSWDPESSVLKVGMISGDFTIGETISGAGATYALKSTGSQVSGAAQEFDTSANYDQNISIETEAINIIDFTEKNPFGYF